MASTSAVAQRAGDNAVRAATDAFGISVGNEKVGVYTVDLVRGFSPVAAGNLRIEGLYFDRVGDLTERLVESAAIRVGLTAQSYAFPAPTGIVDYRLRRVGAKRVVSIVAGVGDFAAPFGEVGLQLPLRGQRLGLVGALGFKSDRSSDASEARLLSGALTLDWQPTDSARVTAFWSHIEGDNKGESPLYFVDGPHLPPRLRRGRFFGQSWTRKRFNSGNYGLIGSAAPGAGWTLKAGLFRSFEADERDFSDLYTNVSAAGLAKHMIIADPSTHSLSTSGEIRATRTFADGPRAHALILIGRGRDRHTRYGGSASLDFGMSHIGAVTRLAKPPFAFGEQTEDRVVQRTIGVGYNLLWPGIGTVTAGLQRTRYDKRLDQPAGLRAASVTSAWLYNAGVSLFVTSRLTVYGSYTTGLEETGTAPENALNRNAALPATRTRQRDAGLRYALTPRLALVAGLFEVKKPYFNLDATNLFTRLGTVRHRGAELSVAGTLGHRLDLVAGAVLLRARVTGEAVALGRVGPKPVGSSGRLLRAKAEYRPELLRGLSFGLALEYDGRRVASLDNRLALPPRAVVNVETRYRFRIGQAPAQLRLQVENIGDTFGWRITSSGGFRVSPGRRVNGYLAVDF